MAIRYVSKSTRNGFAVGNDGTAVAASKALPYLTIQGAVDACAVGDEVVINDGTWAGTEIGPDSRITIGATRVGAIRAFRIGYVTFTDGHSGNLIIMANNTLAAGDILIQGIRFAGTVSTHAITAATSTNLVNLIVDQCIFDRCWTDRGVNVPAGAAATLTVTDCVFYAAQAADAAVYAPDLANAASTAAVARNVFTHDGFDEPGETLVHLGTSVAAGPFIVTDNVISATLVSTTGTANMIRVVGGVDNRILRNELTLIQTLAVGGSSALNAIWAYGEAVATAQPGMIIADNRIHMSGQGTGVVNVSRGIYFGTTTNASDLLSVDCAILRNHVEFSATLPALTATGVLVNLQSRTVVQSNVVIRGGDGIRLTSSLYGTVAGNVVRSVANVSVFALASDFCVITGNTLRADSEGFPVSHMVVINGSGTHSVVGNTFIRLDSDATWRFIQSGAGTLARVSGNRYAVGTGAALPTTPFLQAAVAVSVADWVADHEPDGDWGVDPYLAA